MRRVINYYSNKYKSNPVSIYVMNHTFVNYIFVKEREFIKLRKTKNMKQIKSTETILYISNQEESCKFYKKLFRKAPDLNVKGMTEFKISESFKIGLMPNSSIAKILSDKTPHPETGTGIPRCELYFCVDDVQTEFDNAIKCGAKLISPIADRDWGDRVCYFSDPDGHIVAFAEKSKNN